MRVPLERQLEELAACGLRLNPGVTIQDLLSSHEREVYEVEAPYAVLLQRMGGEVESEPWGRRISDDIWLLDTECVEVLGAYARIVKELARLAGQSHRVSEVRDHLDLEAGEAWVSYTLDGEAHRWDCEVSDDWADPMVLSYIADSFERDGRCFLTLMDGQAMLFLYGDPERLRRLTGLDFERLNPI